MGEFSGIDSKALGRMMGSYKKDKEALRNGSSSIKSRFERHGIDTGPLTELLGICSWLDDQLPMLTRRHHLAIASDEPYSGFKGMVSIDEDKVGQTAQAQQNGKNLAEKFKTVLDDQDAVPEDLFAQLDANSDDADYIKAFYQTLGPGKLTWLSNHMADDPYDDRYDKHPEQLTHDRDVIAKTLGTFTQVAFEGQNEKDKQASWNKWFDKLVQLPQQGFRPDRLIPFLKGGAYDKDFLVALGNRIYARDNKALTQNQFMNGSGSNPWQADHYAQLLDAIAQNPEASGEWMNGHYDLVQQMMYQGGSGPFDADARNKALVKLMHSATIELRRTSESLAEQLTAHLLFDNYMHMNNGETSKWHPIPEIDELYSAIIHSYWADLEHSVTSPTGNQLWMNDIKAKGEDILGKQSSWDLRIFLQSQDVDRRGLEVAPQIWKSFMSEAARDPKSAGDLSALFQAYDGTMISQLNDFNYGHTDANGYLAMKKGLMQQFYETSFKAASESLGMDLEDWAEQTNAFREKAIETAVGLASDMATAGAGGRAAQARDSAIGLGVGTATDLMTSWLSDAVSVKPKEAPKSLTERFKKVNDQALDFSWSTDYRNFAADTLKHGFNASRIEPVTITGADGKRQTYTGNPAQFFTGNPKANFLDKNGRVKEGLTPEQLTALGEWLKDPAVVNRIWRNYADARNARDYPGQDE